MNKLRRWIKAQWDNPKMRQFVMYGFFGGLTTIVNIGLYAALTRLFGFGEEGSNIAAVICAVLFAYVTNKIFVFHSKATGFRAIAKEALYFFGGRLITAAIDIYGFKLLFTVIGMPDLMAKASLVVFIIAINYLVSKYIVFRPPSGGEEKT